MSRKQHFVRLTPAERAELQQLVRAGAAPARRQTRARILLKADTSVEGPHWTDAAIASALDCGTRTVARVRAEFATTGLAATLQRQPRSRTTPRKLDAAAEARLVALACSAPPTGHLRWTLRLLSARLVELGIVGSIAPETVRQTLKKTSSSPG
jgi:hypothetical protein